MNERAAALESLCRCLVDLESLRTGRGSFPNTSDIREQIATLVKAIAEDAAPAPVSSAQS